MEVSAMEGTAQPPDVAEVNSLLAAWRAGDKDAYNRLTEILHADLARIAHLKFRGERVSHTLETHALVNNLYLKLFRTETVPWKRLLALPQFGGTFHEQTLDRSRPFLGMQGPGKRGPD